MGTEIRVACTGRDAARRVQRALAAIRRIERHLTRFDPTSELCRLNADPRPEVPASDVLRVGVRAALWAAERSDGLVDPTLLGAIEHAGYTASMAGAGRSPRALPPAPAGTHPALADPSGAWQDVDVDDDARTIRRPPGVRLDLGGTGKGHAADLAAAILTGAPRWIVDCGGDLRTGGLHGTQDVIVAQPGTDAPLATLRLTEGAVATSGIQARRWTGGDGREAHHLLDPSTGEPAWTGLAQVTALAPTVLAAETLAKSALLRGPDGARQLLALHGGIVVHDDGGSETIGRVPLAPTPEEIVR